MHKNEFGVIAWFKMAESVELYQLIG